MEKRQLEEYLSSGYKDYKSFRQNVILPVFGVERFRDGYGADILKNQPELQQLADTTGICRVLSVGEIKLNEIDSLQIFDITVSDRVKIVRNRSSLQRLIRRAMDVHTSAFMIFHYEDAHWDWRFTYCHKGGGGDEFTNSKRYTFLLGPGEWKSCHTAAEHFMTIYEKQGSIEIKDIEEAFSVEALSKEFFKQYKFYYDQFVAYLSDEVHGMRKKFVDKDFDKTNLSLEQVRDREEKPIRDYVKKLLGRIVFLHFLQKKGWLGVPADKEWGDGDRDFMLHLFEHATPGQKANFLDEILEPLFNDAFDTNRSSDDKNDLYDTKVEGFRSVKIPYLNGGLFERDPLDENESHFPSKYFDDLLTTFSQYNFTIDENDPDDAEVGVDPEMLGRIFENLLEDNKDKGAFYTPKEIVRYMCRESLIAYLQTDFTDDSDKEKIRNFVISPDIKVIGDFADKIDKKLREVKICDPAIGSGAFPMGLLKELFYCRRAIESETVENAAKIKREIIQNNIYGVDIEKGAVDIARLRFWLSLIVEEKSPVTLPNLDFKIMQGNSLLEQYQGFDLSKLAAAPTAESHFDKEGLGLLYDPLLDDPRRELREKLEKYYSCDDHDEKRDLREEIKENVYEQLELSREEIKDIDATTEFFLWHTWFYDVFSRPSKEGFDIVIGNPPYIKEYTNKKAFDGFRDISPYYMGKMDLWYGFACHSLDIAVRRGGILCFIAQNNWTTSAGAKIFRNKVVQDCRIIQMIDFNDYMVFGGSASIQTMIMLFANDNTTDNYVIDHRFLRANADKQDMEDLLNTKETKMTEYLRPVFNRSSYVGKYITFSKADNIFHKIDSNKEFLDSSEIAQGIVFPQDILNKRGQEKLGHHTVGDGIFALTLKELNDLNIPADEMDLIKPYYTTEQIKRYYIKCDSNTLWMIYTDSSYKEASKMNRYPVIKRHLDLFSKIFTSDNKPYGLHRARNEKFFRGEKLISLRKCVARPSFSYSNFDCYVTQTFFVIQTSRWNMKFLTGVLNSSLIAFWLRHKGKMQGENYQIDKEPLMNIPLPPPEIDQTDIIEQIDVILDKLSKNQSADISVEENIINNLVYQIYGLSPLEIEVIEKG